MLGEGRRDRPQQTANQPAPQQLTQFAFSHMFAETSEKHFQNPAVKEKFTEFLNTKKHNAMAPYGSKDYPLRTGPLSGVLHAGLTPDISVFYEIRGRNPHIIYLYFIATHDESGTSGAGRGHNIQKSWAKRVQRSRQQEFNIESQDPDQL